MWRWFPCMLLFLVPHEDAGLDVCMCVTCPIIMNLSTWIKVTWKPFKPNVTDRMVVYEDHSCQILWSQLEMQTFAWLKPYKTSQHRHYNSWQKRYTLNNMSFFPVGMEVREINMTSWWGWLYQPLHYANQRVPQSERWEIPEVWNCSPALQIHGVWLYQENTNISKVWIHYIYWCSKRTLLLEKRDAPWCSSLSATSSDSEAAATINSVRPPCSSGGDTRLSSTYGRQLINRCIYNDAVVCQQNPADMPNSTFRLTNVHPCRLKRRYGRCTAVLCLKQTPTIQVSFVGSDLESW